MTIESMQAEVAALQRLPETGAPAEARVGLCWGGECSHHSTCFATCEYTFALDAE